MNTAEHQRTTTNRTARLGLAGLALALVIPLGACGSSDDTGSSDVPSTAASSSAASSDGTPTGADTEAEAEAADMIGDAVDGGGSSMGLDLETRAESMQSVLDFDDFSIDGSTLTIVYDEGSNDSDAIVTCTAANGVTDEGETVVVKYPDGETTC